MVRYWWLLGPCGVLNALLVQRYFGVHYIPLPPFLYNSSPLNPPPSVNTPRAHEGDEGGLTILDFSDTCLDVVKRQVADLVF